MEEEIIVIESEEEQEIVVTEPEIEYIAPTTQEKTIIPSQEQQIVVPDDGIFALSKVTVEEIPSEYIKPSGTLDITENGEYDVKSYETANVNVGGIEITDASYLFYNGARGNVMNELCSLISDKCKNFNNMCYRHQELIQLPQFITSGGTNFSSMLKQCYGLVSINNLDTSNGTNVNDMCQECTALTTISLLDFGKVTQHSRTFNSCRNLTTLGGFKDLGKGYLTTYSENSRDFDLSYATLLTHESLMNVINNLYDLISIGVKPQSLVIATECQPLLSDEEIAIATNKGWNVSFA